MVKTKFVIPTIAEVAALMKEKMPNWPTPFCSWYAEEFWHHYNKAEWKLSSGKGGAMKNWQSAVHRWKTLKYKEDFDMLQALTPKPKVIDQDTLDFFNEVLEDYRKDPSFVSNERMAGCYVWMKEQGLIKLTPTQREQAIDASKQDLMLGRVTAAKFVFDHLVKNLLDFTFFFKEQS